MMCSGIFQRLRGTVISIVELFVILIIVCVTDSLAQTTERFEIRLSDADLDPHEGRLEVYHDGNWGTVTTTEWGMNEANVVCRQLGFNASFPAVVGHRFGIGLYTSVLDKVKCNGTENRLDECSNLGWYGCSGDCSSDNDVGVRCIKKAMPEPLYQLRLTGSASQFEGLVEVRYNDYWGPVCGADFSFLAAVTVCRQLGFGPPKHNRKFSKTDEESRPKLIFRASCQTWQLSLFDCGVNDDGDATCAPSDPAAYVTCNKPADPYPLLLDSPYYQYQGTVRIYSDGQFGTICDTGWDLKAAEVVCRQLAYGTAVNYHGNSFYGPSPISQPILLDSMQCTGRESLLAQCSHRMFRETSCTHQQEASVDCNEPVLLDFTLRIAGGNAYQGRLEVAYEGQWLAICSDTWDMKAANISCRQIGLGPAVSASAEFDFTPQFVLWNEVTCEGTESRLDQCRTSQVGQYSCIDGKFAGVECSPYGQPNQNRDEIRLTGGILPHDGAVQVYINNMWQAVCSTGWRLYDALVACRQLGYHGAVENIAFITEGPFYMYDVMCEGSEWSLTSCPHSVLAQGTGCGDRTRQAGATCNPFSGDRVSSVTTPLRLVGGQTRREGQIEVFFDGAWGGVCGGTKWDMTDAHVACRQLGYEEAEGTTVEGLEPSTEKKFVLDDVDCSGTELMLSACAHGPWAQVGCLRNETATVVCKELPVQKIEVGLSVGVYVAIVLTVLVVILISAVASFFTCSMRKKKEERRIRESPDNPNIQDDQPEQRVNRDDAEHGGYTETRID